MKNTKLLSGLIVMSALGVTSTATAKQTLPAQIVDLSGTPCSAADLSADFPPGGRMGNGCFLCHSSNMEANMFRDAWLGGTDWMTEQVDRNGNMVTSPVDLTAAMWQQIIDAGIDFDMDGVDDATEIGAGYNPRIAYDENDPAASQLCAGAMAWPGDMPDPGMGGAGGEMGMGGDTGMGGATAGGAGGDTGMGGAAAGGDTAMGGDTGMGGAAGGDTSTGGTTTTPTTGGTTATGGTTTTPVEPAPVATTPTATGGMATVDPTMPTAVAASGDDGGCSVGPSSSSNSWLALALAGAAAAMLRRRRG